MLWGLLVAATSTTLIVALRYLASSGLFAWLTHKLRPGRYHGLEPQIRHEIRSSLVSAAIYGIPAGLTFWSWRHLGWTQMYLDPLEYSLWYLPFSAMIYLFAQDTWFYWTHRAMHWPPLFRLAHSVHHDSRRPTAWAAMSFHLIEAVTGAVVIPALIFLVPIHIGMLGLVLAIKTVMGVTNRMGWEMFPRWFVHSRFGNWVITASHHEHHHEEYRCNYGLYFRFWDNLCSTDRGLTQKFASAETLSRHCF